MVEEQRTVGGDPDVLQAIPYIVGHGALPYGAEQRGERSIGPCLAFDVLDHEFAVVAEKVFDEARGEASLGRYGFVKRPDSQDQLPRFHWLFACQIVALPEGPEERVVFGRMLRRGLEGDPGPCQVLALVVSHDVDL